MNCALKGPDKIELRATLRYHSEILFRQSKFKPVTSKVQYRCRRGSQVPTNLKQNNVSGVRLYCNYNH